MKRILFLLLAFTLSFQVQLSAQSFEERVQAIPSSPGYLVYTALLTQSGTDAPVATVLQNTLGGTVVWTRNGVGDYTGTLTGAFLAGKTIFPQYAEPSGYSSLVINATNVIQDYMLFFRGSDDTVRLLFFHGTDPIEMEDIMGSDPVQVITYVYP